MIGRQRPAAWLRASVLLGPLLATTLTCARAPWGTLAAAPDAGQAVAPRCDPAQPCVAVVIDDIGRALGPLRRLLALPLELTLAVLPHARQTAASLALLRAAGREYWLHLPLEPEQPRAISDEPVVLRRADRVAPVLAEALSRVPGAAGVSNHMGSAFSADPAATARLFAALRPLRLPFLDSRTTPRTVLCAAARQARVPCLQRDVFLDDARDLVTVEQRWASVLALARLRGWAVAIGHPEPATLHTLEAWVRRDHERIRVVALSRLSLLVGAAPWRAP